MTRERYKVIRECMIEWSNEFPDMTKKECLFALYNDRIISGSELDLMMDKEFMEYRLINIANQRAKFNRS
jgi:hypothetical protein